MKYSGTRTQKAPKYLTLGGMRTNEKQRHIKTNQKFHHSKQMDLRANHTHIKEKKSI